MIWVQTFITFILNAFNVLFKLLYPLSYSWILFAPNNLFSGWTVSMLGQSILNPLDESVVTVISVMYYGKTFNQVTMTPVSTTAFWLVTTESQQLNNFSD